MTAYEKVGELLMGLLCEGLGLATGGMKETTFIDGRMMIGNYYPYCPQHDLTVGDSMSYGSRSSGDSASGSSWRPAM